MQTPRCDRASERVLSGSERYLFLFLLIVAVSVWVAKVLLAIVNEANLDHASGAWTSLAIDLANGVFYRPLYSEGTGFGGTRYFPLVFSLHALVIRLGGNPVLSGHLLTLSSGLLLLSSAYLLMRKMGLESFTACTLSAVLLASHSTQYTLGTIRGDMFPLVLNLCGFLVFLSRIRARYREPLTAICFVLAFAAKITAVQGIGALLLWLILSGRTREGVRILLLTLVGYTVFLLGLYYGTSGRILSIFRTCSSGGAGLSTLVKMPIMSARLIQDDSVCLLLLFSAIAIICYRLKEVVGTLPFAFWLVSLLITIAIFGSPGTFVNHLVDVTVASVLLVGYSLGHMSRQQRRASLYLLMSFIIFFACYFSLSLKYHYERHAKRRDRYPQELIEWVRQNEGEILSEDSLIPIMAGKHPYISDPFMLRVILQKDDSLKNMLLTRIKKKEFSGIILIRDPVRDKQWYSGMHLGLDVVQAVLEHYEETETNQKNWFHIYQPVSDCGETS